MTYQYTKFDAVILGITLLLTGVLAYIVLVPFQVSTTLTRPVTFTNIWLHGLQTNTMYTTDQTDPANGQGGPVVK